MKATQKGTGVTVTADESVVRALGAGWVVQAEKKTAPSKKAESSAKSSEK